MGQTGAVNVSVARQLWMRFETIHAVTYFGAESTEAAKAVGLPSWWLGYFGFRAAPLGPVGAGPVTAIFHNFAESFVERWVPEVWSYASVEELLGARTSAAAVSLRRIDKDLAESTAEISHVLESVVSAADISGRPLFAANKRLALPVDTVERLWQLCTLLREHRGDGHVATCTSLGLSGLEAHVLIGIEQSNSSEDLQKTRGWTSDDWDATVRSLMVRGLLVDGNELSSAGSELRREIEFTTDRLALMPFLAVGESTAETVVQGLDGLARKVADSGSVRYPNPMGLARLS